MRKINQAGFAAIEAVLVLVIIGILGFTGWFVWHAKESTDKSLDAANHSEQAITSAKKKTTDQSQVPKSDETTNWQSFTSKDGKVSLKYPNTWQFASNPEYCSDGLLLIGVKMSGSQSSVGKCASDGARAFGQMYVSWGATEGDKNCQFSTPGYEVTEKVMVTVSGSSATKTTKVSTQSDTDYGDWPNGTKHVQYCLESGGFTYNAGYVQPAEYPDALADFNLMVTKTFAVK